MFSMKTLDTKTRALILHLLVEGNSLRATARIADVSRNTVDKLLRDVGAACLEHQDKHLVNLPCKRIEVDEIWSFVGCKQKNVPAEMKHVFGIGDVWTFTAICADTKVVPCWHVSPRNLESATTFMKDVAARMRYVPQLTTDGHHMYLEAVESAFHNEVDYAMLIKVYRSTQDETRYSPAECIEARKERVQGMPDFDKISTSYVERQNLTMRMHMRRFTRLTNAFSKKLENHMHAISLHFMYYNFARIHGSLKVTPAMEAGVADHVWTMEEIANLAPITAPKKRGPYRKRKISD